MSSSTEQHEGKTPRTPQSQIDVGGKTQDSKGRNIIQHTQQAITAGKTGNIEGLRKHAETALKIAEQADNRRSDAQAEEGVKHLKLAVEEAQKGNAADGTKHAEEALTYFKKK